MKHLLRTKGGSTTLDDPAEQHRALRDALRAARQQSGLRQAAVSTAANVSLRTIAAIEAEEGTYRPGPEILIRVALAVGEAPATLLKIAGYPAPSDSTIQRIAETIRGYPARRELDPHEYFSTIEHEIGEGNPALMCVVYSAPPGSSHRADVQSVLARLITRGLWLAMVVPYPRIEAEATTKPNLINYYRTVYMRVVALASELLSRIPDENRHQLGVFSPRLRADHADDSSFVMPPISSTETRSALIRWYNAPSADEEFELGAWVTFSHDRTDRWYIVHSRRRGQKIGGDDLDVLPPWKEYFRDIISGCDPVKGKAWGDTLDVWSRIKIKAP